MVAIARQGGESTGDCKFGLTDCRSGAIVCAGSVGPSAEECDGHDNDCGGAVDESPIAGEGVSCGSDVGQCVSGTTVCQAGALVCQGEVGPSTELCDGVDNDCNWIIDDPFDFNNDPQNCGGRHPPPGGQGKARPR